MVACCPEIPCQYITSACVHNCSLARYPRWGFMLSQFPQTRRSRGTRSEQEPSVFSQRPRSAVGSNDLCLAYHVGPLNRTILHSFTLAALFGRFLAMVGGHSSRRSKNLRALCRNTNSIGNLRALAPAVRET
jgi:hypothetical protein